MQVGRAVEWGCGAPADMRMRCAHRATPPTACLPGSPGGRGAQGVVESAFQPRLGYH